MVSRCFPPIPVGRMLCAKAAPATASLDFQTIPNEFDDDRDGWAELLVHCTDRGVGSIYAGVGYGPGPDPDQNGFRAETGVARVVRRRALGDARRVEARLGCPG